MIYLVGGKHRTGTSMMTRAIALGLGLPALGAPADPKSLDSFIDAREAKVSGYEPNPNGYYTAAWEPLVGAAGGLKGFLESLDGRVAKVHPIFAVQLPDLPNLTVVWMVRDERERAESWQKAFGSTLNGLEDAYEVKVFDHLTSLKQAQVIFVSYNEVMVNPVPAMTKIVGPKAADLAAYVDPSLYRNKVIDPAPVVPLG